MYLQEDFKWKKINQIKSKLYQSSFNIIALSHSEGSEGGLLISWTLVLDWLSQSAPQLLCHSPLVRRGCQKVAHRARQAAHPQDLACVCQHGDLLQGPMVCVPHFGGRKCGGWTWRGGNNRGADVRWGWHWSNFVRSTLSEITFRAPVARNLVLAGQVQRGLVHHKGVVLLWELLLHKGLLLQILTKYWYVQIFKCQTFLCWPEMSTVVRKSSFGYDIVLLVHFFGTPCICRRHDFNVKI